MNDQQQNDTQALTKRVSKVVRDNAQETNEGVNQPPTIVVESPKDMQPNTPPMSMHSNAELRKPELDTISEIVIQTKINGTVKNETLSLYRLRVAEREDVTLLLLKLFEELGAIDTKTEGVNLDVLDDLGFSELVTVAKYMRPIATLVTKTDIDFFQDVPLSDMLEIFFLVLKNEKGIISDVEDFLGTAKSNSTKM